MSHYTNHDDIDFWLNTFHITGYKINDDFSVDVKNNVNLSANGLNDIPVKFRTIFGSFYINDNNLISLQNCPFEVHGDFICKHNNLASLNYCPRFIQGSMDASYNNLKTLKFIPSHINNKIDISNNPELGVFQQVTNMEQLQFVQNALKEVEKIMSPNKGFGLNR